jgi:hypothetical protein
MIVTSALIIWKALMCVTGSESPVVVVLSGSMEPGFKRVIGLRFSGYIRFYSAFTLSLWMNQLLIIYLRVSIFLFVNSKLY